MSRTLLILAILTSQLNVSFAQVCNQTAPTKCGDECHCVDRTRCGGAFCEGGCQEGWTENGCQIECVGSSPTKCGDDCHCYRIFSCGFDVCLAGFGEPKCASGWEGDTCQTPTVSCQDGKYGSTCQYICNCPNRQTILCEKSGGRCTGPCNPGYNGPDCQAVTCPVGRYGPTCQNTCSCPNRQSFACQKTSGVCTGGCIPGYTGPDCQPDTCPVGRYGSTCQNTCNCPNRQSFACQKTSGVCTGGCIQGYTGPDCDTCEVGRYGSTCQYTCNCPNRRSFACQKTSGACTVGCNPGFNGPDCQPVTCPVGRYGSTCQNSCSCPNRQSFACQKTSGVCTGGCNPGYIGPDCQAVTCPVGKYGPTCQNTCNCPNRQTNLCEKSGGRCTGQCKPGYTGPDCDSCPVGRYGSTCQNTCNCPNRQTILCEKSGGRCTGPCNAGYNGTDCQAVTCPVGRYGPTCQNTCDCPNRQSATCDKRTGACTGQCNRGYTGADCRPNEAAAGTTDKSTATSSPPPTGAIVGGVLGIAVLIAVVVVVVIFLRRRGRPDFDNRRNEPFIITGSPNAPSRRDTTNSIVLFKVIDINDLVKIVSHCEEDPDALADEFETLPGAVEKKSETAFLPQHAHKCRYKGMVPYDHSRVVLEPRDSDPYSDFINANHIDGYSTKKKFIAAQGPTAFIMNDFWRMVWQQNTDIIIMLTRLREGNKIKCDQYWPDSGSTVYGHVTVELLATHQFEDFCVRTLTVRGDGKVRTVKQFHFTHWGDHDAPAETTGIISLLTRVQEAKDEAKGPIVVHCSAGVGRTGTYIALDILLEQARAEKQVNIPLYVTRIRSQRANMIQTQGQFTFLHRVLLDAWVGADSIVTTPEFAQQSTSYFRPVPPNAKSKIQSEYEALNLLQRKPSSEAFKTSCTDKNISKNRDLDHLPPDKSRAFLSTYIPGRTDYINAVYLTGYQNKFAYVSTQMPLPDTVLDFWRLVYEQRSSTIVMLNTGQGEDGQYWPPDDETRNVAPFEVQHQWTTSDGGHLIRQLNLTYVKGEQKTDRIVRQFCVNLWKPGSVVPASAERLINLQKTIQEWQRQNDNRPIVVHCLNGVDKTVLLCTCFTVLEKIKAEHIINVLYTVNTYRKHRPGALPNVKQYEFCYEVVRTFIDSFDTYANFVP